MYILGVSCFFHDAAAALLKDGELVAAAEEERFSRRKHDYDFPACAIRFVLEQGRITGADLDYVVFFEKPFVKFERILLTTLQTFPRSLKVFRESMLGWLIDKLWIKSLICERVGVPPERILFSEHHLSHAASAFFCSPFMQAAVLTVDGVGEWATATMGEGKDREIRLYREIRFPHSLGLLYSAFTAFLGFDVNEGEYKVMGMAPYGTPRYVDRVWKLIELAPDGSFRLNMEYFAFHRSTTTMYSQKFVQLFGPPRDPRAKFFTETSGYPSYFGEPPGNFHQLARDNQRYADIAASIQAVLEEVLITMARALRQETGQPNLCIAGGVGLNSVANWRIFRETGFEDLYVQPAAGDAGGAVGAALYVYHTLLGKPRSFVMEHASWGKAYDDEAVRRFLEESGIRCERLPEGQLLDRVVEAIANGAVVGWHQGRFEWGPRALGHRSILADPRRVEMKDIVNTKIKFREPYRPFAPSVLVERAGEFFDAPGVERLYPARFMLVVPRVRDSKREMIPAVTHVDGTGRLQTVFREWNPRYHELIRRFGQATGVPVLLNTSFNVKGEPIVNTPAEAYSTFVRSGIDYLVLGNHLIRKDA